MPVSGTRLTAAQVKALPDTPWQVAPAVRGGVHIVNRVWVSKPRSQFGFTLAATSTGTVPSDTGTQDLVNFHVRYGTTRTSTIATFGAPAKVVLLSTGGEAAMGGGGGYAFTLSAVQNQPLNLFCRAMGDNQTCTIAGTGSPIDVIVEYETIPVALTA